MPPTKPTKKNNVGGPGVKLFITAASVAATLGGWAMISAKETRPTQPVQSVPAATTQVVDQAQSLTLAPLPTLVPPLSAQVMTAGAAHPTASVSQSNARTAQAASAAPQPAAPALVLRDVSAPALSGRSAPAPAAKTGSSR